METHYTDNLQSHYTSAHVPLAHLKLCLRNRRLAAGLLLADFKMPWWDLAETPARARAFGAGEANLPSNSELWSLYQKVRTYFQQNPD